MSPATHDPLAVDRYLASTPEPQRSTLQTVRETLARLLPTADEGISYGIPTVSLHGRGVAGYAAFAHHCSYFPMSGEALDTAAELLPDYSRTKGALHFPVDAPLPTPVIRTLVRIRLTTVGTVRNGVSRAYFADGALRAEGRMRDGQPHGTWTFFRKDGSVQRTVHHT